MCAKKLDLTTKWILLWLKTLWGPVKKLNREILTFLCTLSFRITHLMCQWLFKICGPQLVVSECHCTPQCSGAEKHWSNSPVRFTWKLCFFPFAGASRSELPAPSRRSASSQWRKWELLMSALTLASTRQCGAKVSGELMCSSHSCRFTLFACMGGLQSLCVFGWLKCAIVALSELIEFRRCDKPANLICSSLKIKRGWEGGCRKQSNENYIVMCHWQYSFCFNEFGGSAETC